MYRKILVPLDGSKRAEAILPHVIELANRYNAQVLLARIVEPTPVAMESTLAFEPELVGELVKTAESYLTGVQAALREKGIESQVQVTFGGVVANILDIAKREDVDLIAMASHGRSGLSRVFYGSVTAGVLHGVDRPLLLVRAANDE
jgi:nucleotide-binding universal stress UspA family protein